MQYEEYGEEFVDMLDGMFSFVLLDTHDKSFIAARDAIGICPLYMGWGLDGMHCLAVHLLPKILSVNYFIIFSRICMLFWNCFAFFSCTTVYVVNQCFKAEFTLQGNTCKPTGNDKLSTLSFLSL
jgi:hypothetical protein